MSIEILLKGKSYQEQYQALGFACGFGAGNRDTKFGPAKFLPPRDILTLDIDHQKQLKDIIGTSEERALWDYLNQAAEQVQKILNKGKKPLVIGGDHSIAMGTWTGLYRHLGAQQDFGLIWIDAHLDAHTLRTSPSMNIHGMSLAYLLGQFSLPLSSQSDHLLEEEKWPKIKPHRLAIIGVRSYEPEEKALLESLNVKVCYMPEVKRKGFERVFEECLKAIGAGQVPFGISLDVDAFDPKFCPGTGTAVPQGLDPLDVLPCLEKIVKDVDMSKYFRMMEIVEFNPALDVEERTFKVIEEVIKKLV